MFRLLVVSLVLSLVVSLKLEVHETSSTQSESSPKIGIVSGFHCEQASISEDGYLNSDKCDKPLRQAIRQYGIQNRKDYAQKHGWGVEFETSIGGEWNKLLIIKKYLPKYDWILWMDDDSVFFDMEPDYSQCYNLANEDHDLILSRGGKKLDFPDEHDSINAGVIWIRNSPWTQQYIDELLTIGQNETAFVELVTEFHRMYKGVPRSRGEQDMIGWWLKKRNWLDKAAPLSESMQAIVGGDGIPQVQEFKDGLDRGELKPMTVHFAGCFFKPERELECEEAFPQIKKLIEEPKVGKSNCPVNNLFASRINHNTIGHTRKHTRHWQR